MGGFHHGVDLTPIPPANKHQIQTIKLTHKKYAQILAIHTQNVILSKVYHITQPSKQDGIYTSTSSHPPLLSSDMICELRSFLLLPIALPCWLVKGAVTDPKEILVGIEIRITIVGFRPMYTTFLELHKNSQSSIH